MWLEDRMARITIEDCLEVIPDRFSLVMAFAERSKMLLKGAPILIDQDDENKEVVTSLREIAAGKLGIRTRVVAPSEDWDALPPLGGDEMPLDEELPPEA
jgi:DNA-directed RNA polymerase subunit omega